MPRRWRSTRNHEVFGPHIADGTVTVRVLRPTQPLLTHAGRRTHPMAYVHRGVWAAAVPGDEKKNCLFVAYDGDPTSRR